MILFALLLFFGMQVVQAQKKVITGKATSKEDGSTLPGVTVIVKGTTIGTTTSIDGTYSLDVPTTSKTLLFSFVGMKSIEIAIGNSKTINAVLEPDIMNIEGVVVTALGITREKKALGYSVQEVSGDELATGAETNMINSLSGRVSGISISSSTTMGGSSRVLLRGARSITGNNQPLYVVDGIPIDNSNFADIDRTSLTAAAEQVRGGGGVDYGNMAQDINPNDIASISVLKGANAAALYGSRATNGVIIITTKKGKPSKKGVIGITYNTGVTFEQVSVLPDYQNEYGGGYYQHFDSTTIDGVKYAVAYYGADESWGPKMEGQQVLQWWGLYDYEQGITNTPETGAWEANPDNIKNFFETGITLRNNISFTSGTDRRNFRLSYTNLDKTGVVPNSSLKRNTLNFSGMSKFGKKVTVNSNITYVNNTSQAIPDNGYSDNSIMQKFAQWGQRQWDMDKMSDYINPDGTQRTWNRISATNPKAAYSDNAYWTQNMNYNTNDRDRLYGNIKLNYNINDWLSLSTSINTDRYTDRITYRVAEFSHATTDFTEEIRQVSEINADLLLNVKHDFSDDLSFHGFIGYNTMDRKYNRNIGSVSGGLSIPGFYSLNNSNDPIFVDDYNSQKKIHTVLGNASFGYKRMLYVDITARNDWSSTLPVDNWSYFYPSVTGSFVFSQLGLLKDVNWLSFGKVRVGYAKVGSDTDPYRLYATYIPLDNFGSMPRYSLPSRLNNSELRPEQTTSMEYGTELKFFNNRIGLDLTYYNTSTIDQIFPVSVTSTSGYSTIMKNAGEMTNKGIETMLYLTPVKTDNFSWDIMLNWSKNTNEVVKLYDGVENINLTSLWGVYVTAREGEAYGMIRSSNFVYDENDNVVVDGNGQYLVSQEIEELGSVLPDWTGGVGNTFRYKNLSLNVLIDVRKGGHLFSTTHMFGSWTGLFEESVRNNPKGNPERDPLSEGGGVLIEDAVVGHFDGDGNLIIDNQTNDIYVDAYDYAYAHYSGPRAQNVFETDYWKLREVSIGYYLPESIVSKTFFDGIQISLVGRNLFMWGTKVPHIDPEQATNSGNIQGLEGGTNPSVRTYGFNLRFNI